MFQLWIRETCVHGEPDHGSILGGSRCAEDGSKHALLFERIAYASCGLLGSYLEPNDLLRSVGDVESQPGKAGAASLNHRWG